MAAVGNLINGHEAFLFTNSRPTEDFILFPGNTSDIQIEDNFDKDVRAVERGVEDSGYFSSENFEYAEGDKLDADTAEVSYMWCTDCVRGSFTTDTAASTKANHGSTYDGIVNDSTTNAEIATSSSNQNMNRSKRSVPRDLERPSSRLGRKVVGPTPVQTWFQTHHRHESLAYRLEQPAKRRKTGGRE